MAAGTSAFFLWSRSKLLAVVVLFVSVSAPGLAAACFAWDMVGAGATAASLRDSSWELEAGSMAKDPAKKNGTQRPVDLCAYFG
jgi:hypothetical protein